jgi:cellulose synthase operon protein YhjQ
VAVGLDPRGDLGLHFGAPSPAGAGIASPGDAPEALRRRLLAARGGGATFIPFGALTPEQREEAEAAAARPEWLGDRLAALADAGAEIALLDTPVHPGPWLLQALRWADVVWVVVPPEPAACAALPTMESLIRGARGGSQATHLLVNRFDAGRALAREIVASLRGAARERLLPVVVHDDEAVREALARHHTVFNQTTDAQVVADLGQLADWLVAARKQTEPALAPVAVAGPVAAAG